MAAKVTPETAIAIEAPAPYPGEALDAAIRAARMADPVITSPDGRRHLLIPPGFAAKVIEDDTRLPARPVQRVTVDDRASLSAYANRFSDERSVIIADYDALTVTAWLDWHPHNQMEDFRAAGANSHQVCLKLRLSEEFARWNEWAGKFMAQEEFALFLEENAADICQPDPATMIEISRDFEATAGQTYKTSVRLDNGDRRLTYENETKARNDLVIPQKFFLSIPIYNGEEPTELTALFRWRAAGAGSVAFGFQWHRVEYARRAHFAQIATTAAEETGLPVFMGRTA